MKKFVMILGILAMAGAIVLGLQNKETLEKATNEWEDLKGKVTKVTEELGATEDKRDAATVKETQSKDKRNQASAAIEGVKENLKVIARSVDDSSSDQIREEEKPEVQQVTVNQEPASSWMKNLEVVASS